MIVVDTREQKNQHITKWFDEKGIKWCNEKLDWGDYTIKTDCPHIFRDLHLQDICVVERKANLEEISSNLTHNRDRFDAEFLRSKGTVYLLIENAVYEDIDLGNYSTKFNQKAFRASLRRFEHAYKLHIHYQKDTTYSGAFIYDKLTGALERLLKEGVI